MSCSNITFGRKGRFIFQVNENTPEQQQEFLAQLKEASIQLTPEIERDIAELEELLLDYNPLDMIANAVLRNCVYDPETYREYSHDGNQAFAEYVALLCLSRPLADFTLDDRRTVSGDIVEDIQDRVSDLFMKELYRLAFKDADPETAESPSVMMQLRFSTLSRSFLVRNPAYHPHLKHTLMGLFGPISGLIEQTAGFNIHDAIIIADAVDTNINAKLVDRQVKAQDFIKLARKAVKRYRLRQRETDGVPMTIVRELAKLKPSESANAIKKMAALGRLDAIGDLFCFTIDELQAETNLNPDRISAFLENLSVEFGSIEGRYRHPAPTHPLAMKPIVKLADSFYCPLPEMLYWAMKPTVEDLLNSQVSQLDNTSDNVWISYADHRGKFLEEESLDLLKNAMPHAQTYRGLKYSVVEEGLTKEVELDGLVIMDMALFFVEAKSGSVTLPTRRGALLRVEADLRELVQNAQKQALRAKRYVCENPGATFKLPNGNYITIDAERFEYFFLINTTLDYLDAFVTNLYRLTEAGVLDGELPWSVALTDLMVISELIEFPSQFVHYLVRRGRLNELRFTEAHDELDWFGHYLQEGLYFENALDDPENTRIGLMSYTTQFDDFYLHQMGVRKTEAPVPRQPMPDVMHQILAELEDRHLPGYLQIACALLDMGAEAREEFAEMATDLRQSASHDRRIRDFSLGCSQAGSGISFIFAPEEIARDLDKRLEGYCVMKKYQTKSDRWIGLSCVSDSDSWIYSYLSFNEPWEYDDALDRLVRENLGSEFGE